MTLKAFRAALRKRDLDALHGSLETLEEPLGARLGEKAMELAATRSHADLVAGLIANGVALTRSKPREPPFLAIAHQSDVARALIEGGANVHETWEPKGRRNAWGGPATVLYYRAGSDNHRELKRYLVDELGWLEGVASTPPMAVSRFWLLIDQARKVFKGAPRHTAKSVAFDLAKGTLADVLGFHRRYLELRSELLSAELWAFFHLLYDGCSDDRFLFDVPTVVLARGREVTEAAMDDPDSILRWMKRPAPRFAQKASDWSCASFDDVGRAAYLLLTGREDFAEIAGPIPAARRSLDWDPENEAWLQQKLPKTFAATRR